MEEGEERCRVVERERREEWRVGGGGKRGVEREGERGRDIEQDSIQQEGGGCSGEMGRTRVEDCAEGRG